MVTIEFCLTTFSTSVGEPFCQPSANGLLRKKNKFTCEAVTSFIIVFLIQSLLLKLCHMPKRSVTICQCLYTCSSLFILCGLIRIRNRDNSLLYYSCFHIRIFFTNYLLNPWKPHCIFVDSKLYEKIMCILSPWIYLREKINKYSIYLYLKSRCLFFLERYVRQFKLNTHFSGHVL